MSCKIEGVGMGFFFVILSFLSPGNALAQVQSSIAYFGDSQTGYGIGSGLASCMESKNIFGYSNAIDQSFTTGSCGKRFLNGAYLNGKVVSPSATLCRHARESFANATKTGNGIKTIVVALGDNPISPKGMKELIARVSGPKKNCVIVLPSYKKSGHQAAAIGRNRITAQKAAEAGNCLIIDPYKDLKNRTFLTDAIGHYQPAEGKIIGSHICQKIRSSEEAEADRQPATEEGKN